MTPTTLADIQRRIEVITASSQTPFVVFLKAVYEGEGIIDQTVYDTIEEAIAAFKRAHRITSDMDNKSIIFIDDIPDISEDEERAGSGIVGYTLEN